MAMRYRTRNGFFLAGWAFLTGVALLCAAAQHAADGASDAGPPGTQPSFVPVVAVRHEDYLAARKGFRTKLVKEGPALQKWEAPRPADDADEVEYRSGELRLKA